MRVKDARCVLLAWGGKKLWIGIGKKMGTAGKGGKVQKIVIGAPRIGCGGNRARLVVTHDSHIVTIYSYTTVQTSCASFIPSKCHMSMRLNHTIKVEYWFFFFTSDIGFKLMERLAISQYWWRLKINSWAIWPRLDNIQRISQKIIKRARH